MGWKIDGFLNSSTSIGHLPQVLQGVYDAGAQLLTHFHVADIDVEDGDD